MSSFRDIALNIISSDTLLGKSMSTINYAAHDRIAKQMAEFEKHNKVTVVPMGVSSEYNPMRPDAKSFDEKVKERKKNNVIDIPDNSVRRNRAKASGHQNIIPLKNGKGRVRIGSTSYGTHEMSEAIKIRDRQLEIHNLPPAKY